MDNKAFFLFSLFGFCNVQLQAAQAQVVVQNQNAVREKIFASPYELEMFKAARNGESKVVDEYFHDDVRIRVRINAQDAEGWTALMEAAEKGHADVVDLLIKRGAALDIQSAQGKTALMYAARGGQADCVERLIAAGAHVDMQDSEGRSALMLASRDETEAKKERYLTIVQALTNAQANLNLRNKNEQTALMYAAWHGNDAIAYRLLIAGANRAIVDVQGRSYDTMLSEKSRNVVAGLRLATQMIEDNLYTRHALEQMQKRAIPLDDLNFVLAFGKSYQDKTRSGTLKLAHADKNIGVIASVQHDYKVVITAISFINKDELNHWLTKEDETDYVAWLQKNIDINAAPLRNQTEIVETKKSVQKNTVDEHEDELDDYEAYEDEETEIKKHGLEKHVYGF